MGYGILYLLLREPLFENLPGQSGAFRPVLVVIDPDEETLDVHPETELRNENDVQRDVHFPEEGSEPGRR